MTTDNPPSLLDDSDGYRRQLETALEDHLALVRRHAAGELLTTPWEFEAGLVALRWISQELRTVTLSDDVPF